MPRRDSFGFRRERLLDALAKGQELRESMTRQEFLDDWKASYAAAAILLAVGEHMGPGTPHASADVARPFHEARNLLAHEYFHVSPDRLWLLLERIEQLRKEVEALKEPPARAPRPSSDDR